MLKYLMKYDLKKMTKLLIYLYPITIALAGITRLINIGKDIQVISIIGSVFASLTYTLIANVLVNTIIAIILSFTTSFYKDQSYLTHTLPVKKEKLLLSMYLSALVVIFASVVISVASLFIVLYTKEFAAGFMALINQSVVGLNMSAGGFIALLAFVIFSQICAMMSFGFTSIVKGYSYNKKRGLKGFVWFLCFYFGSMMATVLVAVISTAISGNLSNLFATTLNSITFITILVVALVMYILYAILFYFICQYEFKKGVNVD